jgi:hypothetical protein
MYINFIFTLDELIQNQEQGCPEVTKIGGVENFLKVFRKSFRLLGGNPQFLQIF